MTGVMVDGNIRYVSCIRDFADLIDPDLYDVLVNVHIAAVSDLEHELEMAYERQDALSDRTATFEKECDGLRKQLQAALNENKALKAENEQLKNK